MSGITAVVVAVLDHMKRDRSVVVFQLLLPVGLMVLMGNIYSAEDNNVPRIAVTAPSDATEAIVHETIAATGSVEFRTVADRAALDDAVRRRTVDAGVVVAGRSVEIVGAPDVQFPTGVRFVVEGAVRRVDVATVLAGSDDPAAVRAALATLPAPVAVPEIDAAEARNEAAIGALVLVTFMNLMAFSSLVAEHRRLGVLRRLGAAPIPARHVLAGYGVMFTAVAASQVVVAVLAGRFLVGIDWGPIAAVVAIGAALALAAGGVATLVSTLLPTPESGSSIGGPAGFALAMVGGCLWPLDFVGGALATIGRAVPHFWAVDAFDLVSRPGWTMAGIAPNLLGLVAVGAAASLIGARRLSASLA